MIIDVANPTPLKLACLSGPRRTEYVDKGALGLHRRKAREVPDRCTGDGQIRHHRNHAQVADANEAPATNSTAGVCHE